MSADASTTPGASPSTRRFESMDIMASWFRTSAVSGERPSAISNNTHVFYADPTGNALDESPMSVCVLARHVYTSVHLFESRSHP